jgi:hypothetical protein
VCAEVDEESFSSGLDMRKFTTVVVWIAAHDDRIVVVAINRFNLAQFLCLRVSNWEFKIECFTIMSAKTRAGTRVAPLF